MEVKFIIPEKGENSDNNKNCGIEWLHDGFSIGKNKNVVKEGKHTLLFMNKLKQLFISIAESAHFSLCCYLELYGSVVKKNLYNFLKNFMYVQLFFMTT